MPYEIERKYIIHKLPDDYDKYPYFELEQGYLNTHPTVRIRKEDDSYYLTYKNGGGIKHEEYNLPLDQASYEHMRDKCDGILIKKKRYHIPIEAPQYKELLSSDEKSHKLTIELDLFEESLATLIYAEVEFASEKEANAFLAPTWFGPEVTLDKRYTNAALSQHGIPEALY